jgi:hypothetical protein
MPPAPPPLHQETAQPQASELRRRGLASLIVLGPSGLQARLMRSVCLILALMQMWTSRGILDPDGVSYSDLAKALLRGDWHNGLSSYWSPLYTWFLALGYAVFHPGIHWLIFVSHVINFLAFVCALLAWEWLLREWERGQGPPAHRPLMGAAGYMTIAWVGLHTVGLIFTSADLQVVALALVLAALLLRVRTGVARPVDYLCIGLALGFAFLAKAATLSLIASVLVVLAALLGTWRDRRFYRAAGMAALVVLPFVVALSLAKGHFVINDTGRLNYSWQVTGMSVEGYKEGQFWPGSEARHPLTVVMETPQLIAYDAHPVGTYPVHFDPVWWCEGFPAGLNVSRQLMILGNNIGYCVTRFGMCPALWLAFGCCLAGAGFAAMLRRVASLWFIWAPALATMASYSLIYALNRYLGGAFALLGFCLLAACWKVRLPRWLVTGGAVAIVAVFCGLFRVEFIATPGQFFEGLQGREKPIVESDYRIAEMLGRQGFRAGDEVGLVGNSLMVAWLHLLDGRLIASVPMTITHNDRSPGRPLVVTFERADVFWRSDGPTQQRVLDAFRDKGARWALASNVPGWADVSGWQVAGYFEPWREVSLPLMYFKRLRD